MFQQGNVRPRQIQRRELGECFAMIGFPLRRPGGAIAAAQEVRGYDGVPSGVEWPAWSDQRTPPCLDIRAAGEGVKHQDPAVLVRRRGIADDTVAKPEVVEDLTIVGGELADGEVAGGPAGVDGGGHLASSAGSKSTSFSFPVRTS